MRAALDKFLGLIDHKATAKNFAHALPHLEAVAAEKARLQFIQDLKTAIQDDLEGLIVKYELGPRLAELEALTQEADERQRHAHAPTSAELKDVWRPTIDIATAIRARVSAEQAPRIAALEAELAELQAANAASEARIASMEAETQAAQDQVSRSFTLLDELLHAISMQAPEDEKALRATLDTLLQDTRPVS
ncbi:MIS12/MIND type complex protein [Malassezia pachydermatis]